MAWKQRLTQAETRRRSMQKHIKKIDKQVEQLLERIIESDNPYVISAYETKIGKLDQEKLLTAEKLQNRTKQTCTFEQLFELTMNFLEHPWKLWVSDRLEHKRMLLKLMFAKRLVYKRGKGFSNPDLSILFSALDVF